MMLVTSVLTDVESDFGALLRSSSRTRTRNDLAY
jgi:hypothetical protein